MVRAFPAAQGRARGKRPSSAAAGPVPPPTATTEQLWALYDVMPERLRAAVLRGALAGLRLAESCGLRVSDVDFMRGVVFPRMQYPAEDLKTEISRTPIPVGQSLALQLSSHVKKWPGETLLIGADGGQLSPWALERAVRTARKKVEGLPAGFRYHDVRHYFASLLIAHGADVKTVQARLRHGSAKTTLDTYGHLWPDKDESTKAVIDAVVDSKFQGLADSVRTEGGAL
jgi:integrase